MSAFLEFYAWTKEFVYGTPWSFISSPRQAGLSSALASKFGVVPFIHALRGFGKWPVIMRLSVRSGSAWSWLTCLVLWAGAISCGRAYAQDWDGLSELAEVAAESSIELKLPAKLDLSKLSPTDALLIVGPRQALPVTPITTFLREGGRVALLDDSGTGERLLSAYQVSRRATETRDVPALRGDPNLLIAYPAAEHPLVEGVPLLLTNRAVELFHPDLKPVLTFGRGARALVLAGAIGAGRLVAVGDASVVINQMLQIPGQRRFAKNLLEYLARPGGRIWLVGPDTEIRGSYGAGKSSFSRLDDWLKRASHPDLPPSALIVLALAALTVSCVLGASLLPRRSPYVRPDLFPKSVVYAGYSGRVAVGVAEQTGVNLVWSLLDYRRELEAELAHRLSLRGPFDPRQAVENAKKLGLSAAESAELSALLKSLADLGQTMDSDGTPARIGAGDLGNVVRQGERLLARLGNERG